MVGTGGSGTVAMQFCRGVPPQRGSDTAVMQWGGDNAVERRRRGGRGGTMGIEE
jgi:hypothetical protein